ncbi:hypothetical protein LJC51_01680 [Lachnospiraceae bacterium OttesenSCG-928-J05]|nr:hypothetical protein [Lachnospiraceae bacterium OttesenSCG-928-J05]
MKKAKRVMALLLAVLVFSTSDSYLYQVLAEEAVSTENNGNVSTETENSEGTQNTGTEGNGGDVDGLVENSSEGTETDTGTIGEEHGTADNGQAKMGIVPSAGAIAPQADEFNLGEISASIQGKNTPYVIESGSEFKYVISFNLSGDGGSNKFSDTYVTIPIPDGMTVKSEMVDGKQVFDVNGTGYSNVSPKYEYVNDKKVLKSLVIKYGLVEPGNNKTLTIGMISENFVSKGGDVQIKPSVTATPPSLGTPVSKETTTDIKIKAEDGWKVTKEKSSPVEEAGSFYYINYVVRVQNTNPNGINGYGRQSVTAFRLEDILPALAGDKMTTHDNEQVHDGTPTAGGGTVMSLQMRRDGSNDAYTDIIGKSVINGNTNVIITEYSKATEEDLATAAYSNVLLGSMMPTEYAIRVRFDKDPYLTASTEETVQKWLVTNTAQLTYSLLGEAQDPEIGSDQTLLSGLKKAKDEVDIYINKYLDFAGERILLTPTNRNKYNTGDIKFTLYKDKDGKQVAYNNESKALENISVGVNGQLKLEKVVPGNYFLKEITENGKKIEGLEGLVEIKVGTDGKVEVVSTSEDDLPLKKIVVSSKSQNTLEVLNETTEYGIAKFYKIGFNSVGEFDELEGVRFSVYKEDTDVEVGEGVSLEDGKVVIGPLEPNVTYDIYETSLGTGNSEYSLPNADEPIGTVKITAGGVGVFDFGNNKRFPNQTDEPDGAYYVNESNKGVFKIDKQDSHSKETINTDNTKFEIYGPFSTEPDLSNLEEGWRDKDTNETVTTTAGKQTSVPLDDGWYILDEIVEPAGYEKMNALKDDAEIPNTEGLAVVKVEKNKPVDQVNATVIYNKKLYEVALYKTGTIAGVPISDKRLVDGAFFRIYASEEADIDDYLYELVTAEEASGGSLAYVNNADNRGKPSEDWEIELGSEPYKLPTLSNGTYYYKEVKAPSNFELGSQSMTAFIIDNSSYSTANSEIENSTALGKFKFEKEDAITGGAVSGAKFKIYKQVSNGDVVLNSVVKDAALKDVVLETWNGEAESPLLAPGTYYFKEVGNVGNYKVPLDAPKYYTVTVTANTVTTYSTSIKNDPPVSLRLYKKDSVTSALISDTLGAKFNIKESANGEYLLTNAIGTTNGEIIFNNLVPGKTYYIYETTTPTGYEEPADKLVATIKMPEANSTNYAVAEGKILPYTPSGNDGEDGIVYNTPLGNLDIIKKSNMDQNPNTIFVPYNGAKFQLYKNATKNGDKWTYVDADKVGEVQTTSGTGDDTGKASWSGLVAGTYYLREIEQDNGHAIPEAPIKVKVTPTGNVVLGIGNDDADPSTNAIEIKNEANKGKFSFNKKLVETEGGSPSTYNASFYVYKKSTEPNHKYTAADLIYPNNSTKSTITTEEGVGTSGWLLAGDYILIEVPPTDTSIAPNTKQYEVSVIAGKTNAVLTNPDLNTETNKNTILNEEMGKLFVDKYGKFKNSVGDEYTEIPVAGATFEIYPRTSDTKTPEQFDVNKRIGEPISSDTDSSINVTLPAGDYWIVETKAPEDYKLDPEPADENNMTAAEKVEHAYPIKVTIGVTTKQDVSTSETITNHIEIFNVSDKGILTITKQDAVTKALLNDAHFTLWEIFESETARNAANVDGVATKNVTGAELDLDGYDSEKTYYLLETKRAITSDPSGSSMQTDINGEASTLTLEPGHKYVFEETKAADDHYIDKVWHGPVTVVEGQNVNTVILNPPETDVEGSKKGTDNKGINGAYFAAFKERNDAIDVLTYLEGNDYDNNVTLREELGTLLAANVNKDPSAYDFSAVGEGKYVTAGFDNIAQLTVSKNGGKIEFENLLPGTYYVIELLPSSMDYQYDFRDSNDAVILHNLTVSAGDNANALTIQNRTKGWFEIYKDTLVGGVAEPVSGVKYNVYKAIRGEGNTFTQGTLVAQFTTESNGIGTSIKLGQGYYWVEEAEENEYKSGELPNVKVGKEDTESNIGVDHRIILVTAETVNYAFKNGTLDEAHHFRNTTKLGKFALQKKIYNNAAGTGVNTVDKTFSFELYKKGTDGKYTEKVKVDGNDQFTITVLAEDTTATFIPKYGLPTGYYKIVEVKNDNSSEYLDVTKEIFFEIKAGTITGVGENEYYTTEETAKASPMVYANNLKGRLRVHKTGIYLDEKSGNNQGSENLSGVIFKVYNKKTDSATTDITSTSTPVATYEATGTNGWTEKVYLNPGNYWVVEDSISNAEYSAKKVAGAQAVKIPIGGDEAKYFENTSSYGRLLLKKVDGASNQSLGGAEFTLYYLNKSEEKVPYTTGTGTNTKTYKTSSTNEGIIDFGIRLPAGEYYAVETGIPSGYKAPAEVSTIKVKVNGNDVDTPIYGPYTVAEKSLTDLSTDAESASHIKNYKKFSISAVKKQIDNDGNKANLGGATFELWEHREGRDPEDQKIGTSYTSDANTGVVRVDGLDMEGADAAGKKYFYFKEIKVPEVTDEEFILDEDNNRYPTTDYIEVDNTTTGAPLSIEYDEIINNRKGKLQITKKAEFDKPGEGVGNYLPLEKAKFAIFSLDDGENKPTSDAADDSNDQWIENVTTDKDGLALSKPLSAGRYAVKEIEAPDGFVLLEDYFVFTVANNTITNSFVTYDKEGNQKENSSTDIIFNEARSARFHLDKYDGSAELAETSHDSLTKISGAKFFLYKWNNDDSKWEPYSQNMLDVLYTYDGAGNLLVSGYTSAFLAKGKYKVVEAANSEPKYDVKNREEVITFETDSADVVDAAAGINKPGINSTNSNEPTFEIKESDYGKTINLEAYNSPKGKIRLTKYGDVNNDDEIDTSIDETIENAKFMIYTDPQCKNPVPGYTEVRNTDSQGQLVWVGLSPGTYYIKEVEGTTGSPSGVIAKGYKIPPTIQVEGHPDHDYHLVAEVEAGQIVAPIEDDPDHLTTKVEMLNPSGKGYVRIKKVDDADENLSTNVLAADALDGANFKIQKKDENDEWVDVTTIGDIASTSDKEGFLVGPLDAKPNGTKYRVVETKAPNGYQLNSYYHVTSKEVTVVPNRVPTIEAGKGYDDLLNVSNVLVFKNHVSEGSKSASYETNKGIRTGTNDFITSAGDSVALLEEETSLYDQDYNVDFRVDVNELVEQDSDYVPAGTLTVVDENITLWNTTSDSKTQVGLTQEPVSKNVLDYQINSLTVAKATNTDSDKKVTAKVFVKKKTDGGFEVLEVEELKDNISDITSAVVIGLPANVIGVKVQYDGVDKGFSTDGIILNTTFYNRNTTLEGKEEIWSAHTKEVTRIENQASVNWVEQIYNEQGVLVNPDPKAIPTNVVAAQFESLTSRMPRMSIEQKILNKKRNGYTQDDDINFRTTIKNVEQEEDGPIFKQPVVSIILPVDVELKYTNKLSDAFTVYYYDENGNQVNVEIGNPSNKVEFVPAENVTAYHDQDASGEDGLVPYAARKTSQYTFELISVDGKEIQLIPGAELFIEYNGTITRHDKSDVKSLLTPAYLSSMYTIPATADNPNGRSFNGQTIDTPFYAQSKADEQSGLKPKEYLRSLDYAGTKNSEDVIVSKSVRGSDGIEHGMSSILEVNSAEEITYTLRMTNYSTTGLKEIRFVDVFPYFNDGMILNPGSERGTSVPAATMDNQYNKIELVSVKASTSSVGDEVAQATPYYYVENDQYANSWPAGNDALEPLRIKGSNQWSTTVAGTQTNWKSSVEDEEKKNVSAVGFNVTFEGDGLKLGDEYSVEITLKTPGITLDQLEDFRGKLMANSVAASAIYVGDDSEDAFDSAKFPVEPQPVRVRITLPKGKLGDYVWKDNDNDGIQNPDTDEPMAGAKVSLRKVTYYSDGKHLDEAAGVAYTDDKGWYEFANLTANLLKDPSKDKPSTSEYDPALYVGNELVEYYVIIEPQGADQGLYTPTERYKGDNRAIDSDIDKKTGHSGNVRLNIEEKEVNGKTVLVGDEDMTIDAGFVKAYALGNYVWHDANSNGIQDDYEVGVNGVLVNLYKVKDGELVFEDYVFTKDDTNGNAGYYKFDNLRKGTYVVEFDISSMKVLNGVDEYNRNIYKYEYAFTTPKLESGEEHHHDSDAENFAYLDDGSLASDGRIMRTGEIKLGMNDDDNQNSRFDDRWDAGLSAYSALGGYVFDDVDYDNLHSENPIALTGTKVQLLEVIGGISTGKVLDEVTLTDEDEGRYLFDRIIVPQDNDVKTRTFRIHFIFPDNYQGVLANQDKDGDDGSANNAGTDVDSKIDSDVNVLQERNGMKKNQGYISEIVLPYNTVSTTWDAGASLYSSIGDYVWIDANRDGLQPINPKNEEVVKDLDVYLQRTVDGGVTWETIAQDNTGDDGRYVFKELKSSEYIPDEYRVVFAIDRNTRGGVTIVNQSQDKYEVDSDGVEHLVAKASDETDSDALADYVDGILDPWGPANLTGGYVTVAIKPEYGVDDMSWDCGIIPLISSLGDYVWIDADYDGIQDPEEVPVENVKVELEINRAGKPNIEALWERVDETEYPVQYTTAAGYYMYGILDPGYYRVKFTLPDGYTVTKNNRGNGANDSKASRRTDNNAYYTKNFYLNENSHDPTIDAGLYEPKTRRVRIPRTRSVARRRVRTGDLNMMLLWVLGIGVSSGIIIYEKKVKKGKKKNNSIK